MLLPILTWPDPRLTQLCQPVTPSDAVVRLASDMLDTMYDAPGRGLAAPQVGHLLRMFVMDVAWKDGPAAPRVFLNPQILASSAETSTMSEGCLSLPGLSLPVTRPAAITMRWQALDGSWHQEDLNGMAAICAQHEYDHLDGRLTLHRTSPDALDSQRPGLDALTAAWTALSAAQGLPAAAGQAPGPAQARSDAPEPLQSDAPVPQSADLADPAGAAPVHAPLTAQDRTGGAQ